MLNKIILSGNIGRRPEIKMTQQGKEMATFFLATNLPWKVCAYKNGEEEGKETQNRTHTDWHRITVFRESSVSWIKDKLKQGDMVYVEGRLSYNSWQDRHNQPRLTPHVVVENWQGHVEYLRSSKASFEKNKGELQNAGEIDLDPKALDPQLLALMDDSLQTASDFCSSDLLLFGGDQSQGDTTQENKPQGDPL